MTLTGVRRKHSEKDLYQNRRFKHISHLGLNIDPHLNVNMAPFFVESIYSEKY
jgi:hypothetical protein